MKKSVEVKRRSSGGVEGRISSRFWTRPTRQVEAEELTFSALLSFGVSEVSGSHKGNEDVEEGESDEDS